MKEIPMNTVETAFIAPKLHQTTQILIPATTPTPVENRYQLLSRDKPEEEELTTQTTRIDIPEIITIRQEIIYRKKTESYPHSAT